LFFSPLLGSGFESNAKNKNALALEHRATLKGVQAKHCLLLRPVKMIGSLFLMVRRMYGGHRRKTVT
jgi:hypothetical protein